MRRKILQDLTNSLCAMAVGGQLSSDLDQIADTPDGSLTIDVLEGTVRHSLVSIPVLRIAGVLAQWFAARCTESGIDTKQLRQVQVTAIFSTDRVKTERSKVVFFEWKSESIIQTDEASYEGLKEEHVWHTRGSAA